MYAKQEAGSFRGGRMCNMSEEGLHFETDSFLEPGSSIFIKLYGASSEDRAQVIWCREIVDRGLPFFKVGVKFSEPLV